VPGEPACTRTAVSRVVSISSNPCSPVGSADANIHTVCVSCVNVYDNRYSAGPVCSHCKFGTSARAIPGELILAAGPNHVGQIPRRDRPIARGAHRRVAQCRGRRGDDPVERVGNSSRRTGKSPQWPTRTAAPPSLADSQPTPFEALQPAHSVGS
jgi:hypothetical protein